MHLSELSFWGTLPVLLLLGLAVGLFWFTDRRLLCSLRGVRIHVPRLGGLQWLSALAGVAAGGFAVAGCLVLSMPVRLFWPLAGVVLLCLLLTVPCALYTYVCSLRHTEAHRRYMVANGATRLESLMPCVRRSLRSAVVPLLSGRSAVVLTVPMLFFGQIIGGTSAGAALLVVVLVWLGMLSASVLGTVVAIALTAAASRP